MELKPELMDEELINLLANENYNEDDLWNDKNFLHDTAGYIGYIWSAKKQRWVLRK